MNEKIKDGLHTEWYENGKKKFEGTFKDGKPVGLLTNWFDNGQKKEEMNFKDGRLNEKILIKSNKQKASAGKLITAGFSLGKV